jgi:hypothetical protein
VCGGPRAGRRGWGLCGEAGGGGKNRVDDIERVRHVRDGQVAPSVVDRLLWDGRGSSDLDLTVGKGVMD